MTPFEEELKKALSRREPAGDFTARVLAKLNASQAAHERMPFLKWPAISWRFVPLLALLVALVSGLAYRQHARTVKGERAKQQLMVAMHIAGSQLRQAQLRVKQVESSEVVLQ
jgi:hypothetical protein